MTGIFPDRYLTAFPFVSSLSSFGNVAHRSTQTLTTQAETPAIIGTMTRQRRRAAERIAEKKERLTPAELDRQAMQLRKKGGAA